MSAPAAAPATARVRHAAPTFTNVKAIEQGQFKDISLADYAGKWVLLLFYPMDFTFVCPTEILAFNDALPVFEALNTVVLGVSSDSEYTHFAWSTTPRKQGGLGPNLRLPLLADQTGALARAYGVYIEEDGHPLRGSFLIDPQGVLRQATINDKPVGRSVEEALRLVKAFQFTEKHGEVCPANWHEGSRTIKPDAVAKLEYFEGANGNGDVEMTAEAKLKRPRVA